MKKLRAFVESKPFENTILIVILINALIMGLQTSRYLMEHFGAALNIADYICLGIFIVELLLKIIAYGHRFFTDGWNWFDFIIVAVSLFSGFSFLSVFRILRVFRVLRSLKALKGIRAMRLISGLKKLRGIIDAIGKSLPGIFWSAVLLLLIYYIFGIVGVTLFGEAFPEWFGDLGKSIYTLFQVMTLESWSMGISRPVMEVYGWAWAYFVPFVLTSSFVIMNVVCGVVVNSVSEVSAIDKKEAEEETAENANDGDTAAEDTSAGADSAQTSDVTDAEKADLRAELAALKAQIEKIEKML